MDGIMLFALIFLSLNHMTSVSVHEVMSVIFIIIVILHCLNNRKWIKNMPKLINRQKRKGLLIVNILLCISFILAIFSGIMISVLVFDFLNIPYHERFLKIHAWSTRMLLVLALVHLCMHGKMIMGVLGKNFNPHAPRGARHCNNSKRTRSWNRRQLLRNT